MRNGVLFLALATVIFLGWLGLSGPGGRHAAVELDRRPGAYAESRRILARIQSDLERVAAGRQSWPRPPGVPGDPLEAVVDAYRLYLDGNAKSMDAVLKELTAQAKPRLAPAQEADAETGGRVTAYFTRLDNALAAPEPAARLLAGLRLADALLFLEAAHWTEADPLLRIAPGPVAGTWLRLPCRTVIGRVNALREAQARLGDLAGPMLACPSDNADLGVLEAQAKAPSMLPPRATALPLRGGLTISLDLPRAEAPPPQPWDHETAVAWMDEDPAAAEPILAADTGPDGRLDHALFLHAFRPESQVLVLAILRALDPQTAYDGSDASLLPLLRQRTDYAIPCAVLQAHPALLAATRPVGGDAHSAKSGCAAGRGQVRGFPDAEIAAYLSAAEDADGHFLARHRAPAALAAAQKAALEALKLDFEGLATLEPPPLDHPYQVWGMASLANRATAQRILPLYQDADAKLTAWYLRQGMEPDAAARTAKTGLFRVVWGGSCGEAVPGPSLRGMLLDNAPLDDIRAALAAKEPPEMLRCAVHAGLDPLLLVAVGYSKALPLLLDRGRDVDERSRLGKTALMTAAQHNLLDSARLLLDRGASVNATTWAQEGAGLAHDGRTALMYAAASGSLPLVKLLLERGADAQMADTRGRRAVDYLLGLGPVPANTAMSAEDRAEAARLLF